MNKHKILAMLLALTMLLGLLAGCGGSGTSENTTEAAASEESTAAEAVSAEEASESAPQAEEASEAETEEVAGPEAYYACEDTTEITVLFQYAAFFQSFFPNGWNSSDFWTVLGEKTNTTYTLREVSNLEWTENVNLLCASGDLPDVITNIGSVYNGGLPAAIRDEMIVDLAPYIEENAPHYYDLLTADDYTLKTCLTDDGEMGAMYPLVEEVYPVTNGLWIRQDWLDELGKDIPTTTDELKEVLELFRDNYGADVGFFQMIRANTGTAGFEAEGIWNAFGPCNYFLDDNGEIQYGPMQDYYYDYLNFMKELASEGLFLTSDMTDQSASDLFAAGSIGLEGDSPDNIPSYLSLLEPEEAAKAQLVPMAALGEPTEYRAISSYVSSDAGGNISISTNCEDPEVVIKAMDYLFTDEGALLSSYGIEGETYEINADGEPEFTDVISANPDGIPVRAALGYFCNPGVPGLMDYARNQSSWDDVQKSAFDVWNSAYTGSSGTVDTNSLALTEDEQDSISVYKSDMVTYVTEWVNGIVFGDTVLDDAAIEEFQNTMENTMHISDILDVYNAAYARFQSRSIEQ
jgi:putative aldouronate transport system substrate-binding protein